VRLGFRNGWWPVAVLPGNRMGSGQAPYRCKVPCAEWGLCAGRQANDDGLLALARRSASPTQSHANRAGPSESIEGTRVVAQSISDDGNKAERRRRLEKKRAEGACLLVRAAWRRGGDAVSASRRCLRGLSPHPSSLGQGTEVPNTWCRTTRCRTTTERRSPAACAGGSSPRSLVVLLVLPGRLACGVLRLCELVRLIVAAVGCVGCWLAVGCGCIGYYD
jgi:hypothetical protein